MATRRDQDLKRRIRATLRADSRISAGRIRTTVVDRVVTLGGVVASWSQKLAALEIVERTREVRRIDDRLEVKPRSRVSDPRAEELVQSALNAHADIPDKSVAVRVKRGRCILAGNVPSRAVWEIAQQVVLGCKGIRSVDNLLVIDRRSTREDASLVNTVRAVLAGHGSADMSRVRVRCVGSRAVLTGTVDTLAAKADAGRMTARIRGVIGVINRVRVAGTG